MSIATLNGIAVGDIASRNGIAVADIASVDGQAWPVAFGESVAVAHYTSPYVTAYPWSGSGFGTKFSNPGTLPAGNASSIAYSNSA